MNVYAQTRIQYPFESLTINEGLSQGFVSSIFQDKKGIMWFTTADGLNKYDGYTFTVYHHDPDDSTSLGNDDLTCVFEDSKGRLWVGTRQDGINLFDREKKVFYQMRKSRENSLRSNSIFGITEDKTGALWIRTREGIDRLEIANGKSGPLLARGANSWQTYSILFSHIKLDSAFEAERNKSGPENIFIDSRNHIFLTTNNRLWELIYNTKQHSYQLLEKFRFPLADAFATPVLLEDTINNYLLLINKEIVIFPKYKFSTPKKIFTYSPFKISCTIDRMQRVWLHNNEKITQVQLETGITQHFISAEPVQMQALSAISVLFKDRTGVIWIGTSGYGLLKYDPEIEYFHHKLPGIKIYQIVLNDSVTIINNYFQELTLRKGRAIIASHIIDSATIKKNFQRKQMLYHSQKIHSEICG